MIHICRICNTKRDCECGDCGERKKELCIKCNNFYVMAKAKILDLNVNDLFMDMLGGIHIPEKLEMTKFSNHKLVMK